MLVHNAVLENCVFVGGFFFWLPLPKQKNGEQFLLCQKL